jgi:hypothetical protein
MEAGRMILFIVFVLIVLLLAAIGLIEWLWSQLSEVRAHVPTIREGRYEGLNRGIQSDPVKHVCGAGDVLFVNIDLKKGTPSRVFSLRVDTIRENSVVLETTVWNEEL